MNDKIFVDSNIWLYAFMKGETKKYKIANEIINTENICISTQVINEVSNNLIKKSDYKSFEIKELICNYYDIYEVFAMHRETFLLAANLRDKYLISYWDSLILASAIENNCNLLYTEDMQNNQVIEEVLIIKNPFL